MNLDAVVESKFGQSYRALGRFLRSGGGRRFGRMRAVDLDANFADFKDELERYARPLSLDERFDLYKDVRNLTTHTPENPVAVHSEYTLEKSFLTQDEINILILKLIHRPISQRALAEEQLLCSRQAVSARVQDIKDGARIGAASVQLDLKNKHQVSSTAHPVSLVLNLSEVYALISALQVSARQRVDGDPKAFIEQSLAEMVFFQLSDYAKEQILPRLEQAGIHMEGSVEPCFEGNALSSSGESGVRGKRQRLSNWLYYEKSGRWAKLSLAGASAAAVAELAGAAAADSADKAGKVDLAARAGQVELVGRILPGSASPERAGFPAGANPASCFRFQLRDGVEVVLSWADVVDVSGA